MLGVKTQQKGLEEEVKKKTPMVDEINNVKIKFAPFKCPKCNGHGSVNYGKISCTTCKATGVILVNQKREK